MNTSISLSGIQKAIDALNYRNLRAPKYRLVHAILQFYVTEDSVNTLGAIESDALISSIWGKDTDIRSKRKNLSSLKSSVNADLMKCFKDGENTEGITIGPSNTFVMSDDAKSRFLEFFAQVMPSGESLTLETIAESSNLSGEYLKMTSDSDILQFLNTALDALSSTESISKEKIPEILDGFGELFKKIPHRDLLNNQGKLKGLIKDLSDKTELSEDDKLVTGGNKKASEDDLDSQIAEVADVVEEADEETEKVAGEKELAEETILEEVDEEELEETEADDEPEEGEIEAVDDSEIVEITDVVEEVDEGPNDTTVEDIPEDEAVLEEIDEEELEELEADDESEDEELEAIDDSEIAEVAKVVEEIDEEAFEEKLENAEPIAEIDEDALVEDAFAVDIDTTKDKERNRRLSERFDGFLGAVEKRYNEYLFIPKGDYIIGNEYPEKDELPRQTLKLKDLFFGKFPVTNSLFEIFVEQTGYQTSAEENGYGIVYQGRFQKKTDPDTGRPYFIWNATYCREKREGAFWYQPNGPGSNLHKKRNHPVVQVSLKDAIAFASWVGKRLPTEAEWEAVSRSNHGYALPWGNEWKEGMCNIEVSEIADTAPVDHFPDAANAFGISDLLGNTLEWTAGPFDLPNPLSHHGDYQIARGGSWISDRSIRLYSRFQFPRYFSSNILGFRCLAD